MTRTNHMTRRLSLLLLIVICGWMPMGIAQADTVTYYHPDALGTPVMESNAAGQVTYAREHRPYGEQALGATKHGPGFTGHVGDADTGLIYMQQRYYDHWSGRFLSVDPIAAYSKRGINFNRYWYAAANPYKFIDPDGRWVCQGGAGNCAKFEAGLAKITNAAISPRLTQGERSQMQRIVDFYGKKGDSKVSVSFANLGGPGGNAAMRKDGGEHVTLDMQAATRNTESRTLNVLARVIAHEGEHGANDQQRRTPVATRAERKQEEIAGFTAQAVYQKFANFAESSRDGWTPFGGFNQENLERQAQGSVDASCGSSTVGSCK